MCDVHGCGALQAPTRRRLLGAGAALASWWLGAPLAAKEALPERGLADRRAAGFARFTSAAVDEQFAEEIARRAVRVEEVA